MKTKLFGIALMLLGLICLGWVALIVLLTKGMLMLIYGIIPLIAGWLLFDRASKKESPNQTKEAEAIRLIEKHPVLKTTAFLLVGFIGVLLLAELGLEYFYPGNRIPSTVKFTGIFAIVAASLIYERAFSRKEVAS